MLDKARPPGKAEMLTHVNRLWYTKNRTGDGCLASCSWVKGWCNTPSPFGLADNRKHYE